jgi:hypothetical protein
MKFMKKIEVLSFITIYMHGVHNYQGYETRMETH